MSYSKNNLPESGELIELEIAIVSKCCGPTLIGYYCDKDEDYIYISDGPACSGRIEKIGWSGILSINASSATENICIDML